MTAQVMSSIHMHSQSGKGLRKAYCIVIFGYQQDFHEVLCILVSVSQSHSLSVLLSLVSRIFFKVLSILVTLSLNPIPLPTLLLLSFKTKVFGIWKIQYGLISLALHFIMYKWYIFNEDKHTLPHKNSHTVIMELWNHKILMPQKRKQLNWYVVSILLSQMKKKV